MKSISHSHGLNMVKDHFPSRPPVYWGSERTPFHTKYIFLSCKLTNSYLHKSQEYNRFKTIQEFVTVSNISSSSETSWTSVFHSNETLPSYRMTKVSSEVVLRSSFSHIFKRAYLQMKNMPLVDLPAGIELLIPLLETTIFIINNVEFYKSFDVHSQECITKS